MSAGVGDAVPGLPRVWRPRRVRAVVAPSVLVLLAGAVVLAVLLPPGWSLADRVGVVCFGGLVCAGLALLARPMARADESGLTVVNVVRRRRIDWTEVVGVGLGRDDPWASIDLADGTVLAVMALQASDGDRARRGVAELAALASAYGESTSAAP